MHILRALVVASILLGLFAGCSDVVLTDVSTDPDYRDLVGDEFEIVGAVDLYGIRQHSKAPVEYRTLIPPPGIGGYEVASRHPLEIGTRITVAKVMRTTRWLDCGTAFIVSIEGEPTDPGVDTTLELNRGNKGASCRELNPKIYRKIRASGTSL